MAPSDSVICLIPRSQLRPDLMRFIADCSIEIPGCATAPAGIVVRWRISEAASEHLLADLAQRQALALWADGSPELRPVR